MRLRFSAPCSCFLSTQGDTEKLAIFGLTRARRGAELKVMAAVETKVPGYFTDHLKAEEDDKDGFGTRTLVLKVCATHGHPQARDSLAARRKNVGAWIRPSDALLAIPMSEQASGCASGAHAHTHT